MAWLLALLWATSPLARPTPAVLVTDCGCECDDQWTLAHLLLSPRVGLRGVVTTHAPTLGKPPARTAAGVARKVLAAVGREVPVIAGADEPLPASGDRPPGPGADFLLKQAKGYGPGDRLRLLVIGAATDLAEALLFDPTLADRIEVVAMGFDGWPAGGDPWNVKNDVRAWQVLLASPVPLTVGDAAVTRRDLMLTRKGVAERFGRRGRAGAFLVGEFLNWLDRDPGFVKLVSGAADAWPVWDEVVTAHLLGFTRWADRPRPLVRPDRTLDHPPAAPPGSPTVRWVTGVDAAGLWADLERRLDAAGGR